MCPKASFGSVSGWSQSVRTLGSRRFRSSQAHTFSCRRSETQRQEYYGWHRQHRFWQHVRPHRTGLCDLLDWRVLLISTTVLKCRAARRSFFETDVGPLTRHSCKRRGFLRLSFKDAPPSQHRDDTVCRVVGARLRRCRTPQYGATLRSQYSVKSVRQLRERNPLTIRTTSSEDVIATETPRPLLAPLIILRRRCCC